jgi:hypothetical protein
MNPVFYSKRNSFLSKRNKTTNDYKLQQMVILQQNLKLLNIVLSFELKLNHNKLENYSLSFLQEFEKIKFKVQENTIQSIQQIKY